MGLPLERRKNINIHMTFFNVGILPKVKCVVFTPLVHYAVH